MRAMKSCCLIILILLSLFSGCGKEQPVKEQSVKEKTYYTKHQLIGLSGIEKGDVRIQNYRCIPTEKYVYVTSYPEEYCYCLTWCTGTEDDIAMVCVKTESEGSRYWLHMIDGETKKEEVYPLDDALASLGEYGVFSAMSVTDKELVIADSATGAVVVIDYRTGTQTRVIPTETTISYLAHGKGGIVFCMAPEGDGTLYTLQPSGGKLEKKAEQIFLRTGRGKSFLVEEDVLWIGTDTALFSYHMNTGKAEELFSYVNYDILPHNNVWIFHSISQEDGEQWKLVTDNQEACQVEVCRLSPVAFPGAAIEKEVITLSNSWLVDSLKEAVVAFNKSSDKYRVEVITARDTEEFADYHNNQTIQILSGEGPDIFSAPSRTNYIDFIQKGVLEDLLPYMQADLEEEKYFTNALYAYENQGKVFAVSPDMDISLLVGRQEVIGQRKGWTFAELCGVMEANPQIKAFMPDTDALSVLQLCYFYGGIESTDFEALRQCILFAQKYGQALPDGEEPVLGENVLLMEMYLNGPAAENLQDFIKRYGNDLAFVGYPREDRQGIRQASTGWSINANSSHKEGAWAFLCFLLEREYQYTLRGSFPIMVEVYEKKLTENVGRAGSERYLSEEERSKIRELTDESNAFMKDLDYEVWDIVSNEAQYYFAGIKTLDEVMEIIQGRLELYESEKE